MRGLRLNAEELRSQPASLRFSFSRLLVSSIIKSTWPKADTKAITSQQYLEPNFELVLLSGPISVNFRGPLQHGWLRVHPSGSDVFQCTLDAAVGESERRAGIRSPFQMPYAPLPSLGVLQIRNVGAIVSLSFHSLYLYALCMWQGRQCCSGTVFSSGNRFYRRAEPQLYVTSPQPSMQGDRPPPTRVKLTPSSRQDALIHAEPASHKSGIVLLHIYRRPFVCLVCPV